MAKPPTKKPTGPKKPTAGVVGRGAQTVPTPTQEAHGDLAEGARGAQTVPTPTQEAHGPQVVKIGIAEEHEEALPIAPAGGAAPLNLSFDPKNKILTINQTGEIEFLRLYHAVTDWEGSFEGMTHSSVMEGSGNIELPDGTRTPRCMILKGGWRLSAAAPVSITGGYVTGKDDDGKAYHPVVEEARDRVHINDDTPQTEGSGDLKAGESTFSGPGRVDTPGEEHDGDVTIEVPTGGLTLTGHPPTVDVTSSARQGAVPHRVTVETLEEIEDAARRRFANAPSAAIAEAKQAKVIAIALLTAIDDLRPNNPEAGSAKDLLAKQIDALDRIIVVFESGDDTQMALQTYRELLGDVLRELLKALKNESVIRGLLAVAAISVAGVAGVQLSMLGEGLIAGAIVGPGVIKAVGKIVKDLKDKGK